MTTSKRIFDLFLGTVIAILLFVPLIFISIILLALEGRPVFYISERMSTIETGFSLIKFRTMRNSKDDTGVSGGNKAGRITKLGSVLRRYRIDELPQIINVLRGDISLVGPRPPLREYVEAHPNIYQQVLNSRPGVTGLASIYFHKHEERILSKCVTATETDTVYRKNCIPRKAKIDIIYQRNQNMCYDIYLLIKTVFRKI